MDKAWERTFIADGTVTTEPKNKNKITGEGVDNYKTGAIKVAPEDKSDNDAGVKAARGGIYASFAHQRMLDILAEKAACDSKKKKKAYSEAVVNTKECEKKPEEEKDMRGTYAKINLVKNKLRSMGQKDPCVMLDDVDEEAKPGVVQKDGSMKIPVVPFKKEVPKTGKTEKPYPGYNPQKGVGDEYKP